MGLRIQSLSIVLYCIDSWSLSYSLLFYRLWGRRRKLHKVGLKQYFVHWVGWIFSICPVSKPGDRNKGKLAFPKGCIRIIISLTRGQRAYPAWFKWTAIYALQLFTMCMCWAALFGGNLAAAYGTAWKPIYRFFLKNKNSTVKRLWIHVQARHARLKKRLNPRKKIHILASSSILFHTDGSYCMAPYAWK